MNIYHEEILDHYHDPRHYGDIAGATHGHCALNPTCGDKTCIDLKITKDVIVAIGFTGHGCAISQAAASMLCEKVAGASVDVLKSMTKDDMLQLLGLELSPNRLKCGLLALETAHKALHVTKL